MKKRFLVIAALIAVMVSCGSPNNSTPNNGPDNPDGKTTIVFDNTRGICAVTVYSSHLRGEESILARMDTRR